MIHRLVNANKRQKPDISQLEESLKEEAKAPVSAASSTDPATEETGKKDDKQSELSESEKSNHSKSENQK